MLNVSQMNSSYCVCCIWTKTNCLCVLNLLGNTFWSLDSFLLLSLFHRHLSTSFFPSSSFHPSQPILPSFSLWSLPCPTVALRGIGGREGGAPASVSPSEGDFMWSISFDQRSRHISMYRCALSKLPACQRLPTHQEPRPGETQKMLGARLQSETSNERRLMITRLRSRLQRRTKASPYICNVLRGTWTHLVKPWVIQIDWWCWSNAETSLGTSHLKERGSWKHRVHAFQRQQTKT